MRLAGVALVAAAALGCGSPPRTPPAPTERSLRARAAAELGTLPPAPAPTPLSELGRRLFFEMRVSVDGSVGCVTCHAPALWGTDGLPRSLGVLARPNDRNAPTVLDAAPQVAQHWRGERASLEEQAEKELLGTASFGLRSADEAARRLAAIPGMLEAFQRAFPEDPQPLSPARFGTAVGAYVRTLRAPGPFDAFLAGDDGALSDSARRGLARFLDLGCSRCHDGPLLGGQSFRTFGVFGSYPEATGSAPVDPGREAITHDEDDRHVFKVSPLRQVARTGPYFHDGSVVDLGDAVRIMARIQLGVTLGPAEVADLVAFLDSLTGEVPASFSPPSEGDPSRRPR